MTLFLGGDVMTGRGVDQVLEHPSEPRIHEPYMTSALQYVELAERAHGRIPRRAGPAYVWGDALDVLRERAPDRRIVNLETSVTTSEAAVAKGINYRMHPGNVACLTAAGVDCCVLANNHVMDWGAAGLEETLETLRKAGVATAGAGRDAADAEAPAALEKPGGGRVLVFGFATPDSGVAADWAAGERRPGLNVLAEVSERSAARVAEGLRQGRRPGDRVVASIHWGGNWGHEIPKEQRGFARRLVEEGGADVVHGHSSHHPKGIEVHGGRPILYGCGDLINDYEGISGHEEFRGDLVLGYFCTLDSSGRLVRLEMTPFRIRRFRLERAARADVAWLRDAVDRATRELGTRIELTPEGDLALRWS